jgi:intergrase/recombinase
MPVGDLRPKAALRSQKVAIQWKDFKSYLKKEFPTGRTPATYIDYAKPNCDILLTGDLSKLLAMTDGQKRHTMKALSSLAKFMGCYDSWHAALKRHGIKWASPNASMVAFEKITSDTENIDSMLDWLKKVLRMLPAGYGQVLRFNTLTGLRPTEALQSLKLLKADRANYLKGDMLQHYKYPKTFIRRTKKAYISIVTPDILKLANNNKSLSYQAMRIKTKRAGLPYHAEYCRQIFSTYLRDQGIEAEIVNILQGRIPPDVFLRHYYRPNFKKKIVKVKACLGKLYNEISP